MGPSRAAMKRCSHKSRSPVSQLLCNPGDADSSIHGGQPSQHLRHITPAHPHPPRQFRPAGHLPRTQHPHETQGPVLHRLPAEGLGLMIVLLGDLIRRLPNMQDEAFGPPAGIQIAPCMDRGADSDPTHPSGASPIEIRTRHGLVNTFLPEAPESSDSGVFAFNWMLTDNCLVRIRGPAWRCSLSSLSRPV